MPRTILAGGFPANNNKKPQNNRKSSKTRWLQKAEGQVDSTFAAKQLESTNGACTPGWLHQQAQQSGGKQKAQATVKS